MELDKRIKEGKRPLNCFDTEQAKQFIGKECYFSNIAYKYEDLDDIEKSNNYVICTKGILSHVDISDKDDLVFQNKETALIYRYCLPCEWIKESEKKYRPFSLDEFLKIFDIGDQIDFKGKGCCDEVKVAMFTGYITDVDRTDDKTPGAVELMLGNFHYSLLDLFKDYELFFEDKWQPFGIEFKE